MMGLEDWCVRKIKIIGMSRMLGQDKQEINS